MAELFSKQHPSYLNISVSMIGCVLDNMYVIVIWCVWLFSIIILQNRSLGALFDVFIGLISIKVTGKTLRGSISAKKQKGYSGVSYHRL